MKDKIIGTAYVNVIKDEKGEVKFAYGFDLQEEELSLNDLAMLNSFLDLVKSKALNSFDERVELTDKDYSIEKD